ncbi:hypothetical protein [Halodurantibacterium flavum]|uniref:Mannosyltransferase n=1 Tax=Halodurantibacterium flavum TaxID=1382802 RepID=A0ABW4RZZ8_9RHOB
MNVKRELAAKISAALALDSAAEAEAALAALAADVAHSDVGTRTALGLPRKLHSAQLSLAKRTGTPAQVAGLQTYAVPKADLLEDIFATDTAGRAALVRAASAPVPELVHQIWVGGEPPPACAAWARWAERHGWEYRLWREKDLEEIGVFKGPLWQAMWLAGDMPGAVDVARYHVLQQMGGLYLDCDWYPARLDLPPAAVIPATGLSALAEPAPRSVLGQSLLLSNALLAAPRHHPVMTELLAALPKVAERIGDGPAWWTTGPLPFTYAARQGPVSVLDPALVAARLPWGASLAEVEHLASNLKGSSGLLIAWKSW